MALKDLPLVFRLKLKCSTDTRTHLVRIAHRLFVADYYDLLVTHTPLYEIRGHYMMYESKSSITIYERIANHALSK